jgi:hypothetical protein
MLKTAAPRSSTQAFDALNEIHQLIVRFVKENKSELKRGFVFTPYPSDKMYFYTLLELQEDPMLLGCNEELRAQFLTLVGTYDFHNEYVYIIRVDNEEKLRFIAQTGPLDENGASQIITPEEIQEREANRLRLGMHENIVKHKVARKNYKIRRLKKWRWPVQFSFRLIEGISGQDLVLGFGAKT